MKYRSELNKLRGKIISDIKSKGEVNLLNNLIENNQTDEQFEIVELWEQLPIIEARYDITGNTDDFWFEGIDEEGVLTLININNEVKTKEFSLYDLDVEQLLLILEEMENEYYFTQQQKIINKF